MNNFAPRCTKCGKPTAVNTRGSLTAWLFSQSKCNCKLTYAPQPERDALDARRQEVPEPQKSNEADSRLLGQLIDNRYEVLSLIGTGGMGSIYRVLDQKTKLVCALKLINKSADGQDALEKRLELEARTIGSLNHPNIVAIQNSGKTEDGSPFLTMDYVEGRSLESLLQAEQALEQERALNIFIEIAESLVHAHSKGVVHRDLKPSNVLLARNEDGTETVKIVDFGIAKTADTASSKNAKLTQPGELIGSPLYMSPEQCKGEELNARSDIYSLGCIMYETLAGRPPFEADNPVRVLIKHISEEAPALPKKLHIDAGMNYLTMRCLAKDPMDRYANSESLLRDLKRLRDGKQIGTNFQTIIPKLLETDPNYGYQSTTEFLSDLKALALGTQTRKHLIVRQAVAALLAICAASVWLLCDAPGTDYALQVAANGDVYKQAEWHVYLARLGRNLFGHSVAKKHAQASVTLLQSYSAMTEVLSRAESAADEAVKIEDEFELSHDKDTPQFLALGDRLVRAGQFAAATEAYTKGWRSEPPSPDSEAANETLVHDLGTKALHLNGSAALHQQANLVPAEIDQLRAMTLCKLMAGNTDKEGPYQDLLDNCYNNMGWLYAKQKRVDEEISMFQHALNVYSVKSDPIKAGFAMYTLALGYTHAGRTEDAERWFKQAEQCSRDASDKCVEAVCDAWLAWLYADKKDNVRAKDYASKAIRLMQSNPPVYKHEYLLPGRVFLKSAEAYEAMNEVKAAEKIFDEGLSYQTTHGLPEDSSSSLMLMDSYGKFLRSLPDRADDAERIEKRAQAIRTAHKDDR
jgi:serine/threonine protein kinase